MSKSKSCSIAVVAEVAAAQQFGADALDTGGYLVPWPSKLAMSAQADGAR